MRSCSSSRETFAGALGSRKKQSSTILQSFLLHSYITHTHTPLLPRKQMNTLSRHKTRTQDWAVSSEAVVDRQQRGRERASEHFPSSNRRFFLEAHQIHELCRSRKGRIVWGEAVGIVSPEDGSDTVCFSHDARTLPFITCTVITIRVNYPPLLFLSSHTLAHKTTKRSGWSLRPRSFFVGGGSPHQGVRRHPRSLSAPLSQSHHNFSQYSQNHNNV